MFVTAKEFLDRATPHGFDKQSFNRAMAGLTDKNSEVQIQKIQGNEPYMVYSPNEQDTICMTFIHKNHKPMVEQNSDLVVDAFELMRHMAH